MSTRKAERKSRARELTTVSAQEYLRFQTESELMNAIASNAQRLGYKVYHTKFSVGSEKGFPDLHISGHGVVRYVETKGPKGRVEPEQQEYIDHLRACGQTVYIAWSTNNDDFDIVMKDLEEAYERNFNARRG